jgi:LCP family protein required for cell wall assembly
MPPEEKPYRVYKGGRAKGRVPAPAAPGRGRGDSGASTAGRGIRARWSSFWSGTRTRLRGGLSWKRWLWIGLVGLFVLFVAWAVGSYLVFRSGVAQANKRLDPDAKAALTSQSGLLLSHPTTILLLGTDTANVGGRSGDRHADSIVLLRTDPSHHRLSYLSIPRDLYVPVSGLGNTKINASYQSGGAALAIKTVQAFTGEPVNHVVVVDFEHFKDLIDAEGGITINVPKPILSNRFDCPYATEARCAKWEGWRFAKGRQHFSGQRALIYSRVRENRLDPAENDLTRGARQQAVLQAATAKLTSPWTLARLPFNGDKLMKPLTTDLTAAQLMQLGWVKFRSGGDRTLYCRLGGDPETVGGQAAIVPTEENRNVLSMFEGRSAPQPPDGTYAPGCRRGRVLQ